MKLHIFNPDNDLALANFETNFISPASARIMASDLSLLPYWWALSGDAVCVHDKDLCERFISDLPISGHGVSLVTMSEADKSSDIEPWGWNPSLLRTLERNGFTSLSHDNVSLANLRRCASRERAVEILRSLNNRISSDYSSLYKYICGQSEFCTNESQLADMMSVWPDSILKAPWSGSGKGLRFGRGGYVPPLTGWCRRIISLQGGVVIEPFYDKVHDLAWEFNMDGAGGVRYCGISIFNTTHQGIYNGNRVASEEQKESWLYERVSRELCDTLKTLMMEELKDKMSGYTGRLGVDMMLCRDALSSNLMLHPCVEVNVRNTMGWVSCDLAHLLAEGSEGVFCIDYSKEEGFLLSDDMRRKELMPCISDGNRIVSGYLSLTPVTSSTHYRARLEVVTS